MICVVILTPPSSFSANRTSQVKMPAAIERFVRKQNIEFMHNKNQYSMEFFQFMRKLLTCNAPYVQVQPGQDLVSAVLFSKEPNVRNIEHTRASLSIFRFCFAPDRFSVAVSGGRRVGHDQCATGVQVPLQCWFPHQENTEVRRKLLGCFAVVKVNRAGTKAITDGLIYDACTLAGVPHTSGTTH